MRVYRAKAGDGSDDAIPADGRDEANEGLDYHEEACSSGKGPV